MPTLSATNMHCHFGYEVDLGPKPILTVVYASSLLFTLHTWQTATRKSYLGNWFRNAALFPANYLPQVASGILHKCNHSGATLHRASIPGDLATCRYDESYFNNTTRTKFSSVEMNAVVMK